MLESYLKKYLSYVEKMDIPTDIRNSVDTDSKIFSIWLQGEENAPKIVKACYKRIRDFYGDRFIVLDADSIFGYIELPDFIVKKWKEGKMIHAHFTDICRIELLYRYGGIWLDATDYLTDYIPKWVEQSDFFIFAGGESLCPHSFIQNCFIRSEKAHPLLGAWRDFIFKYWENEDKAINYFLVHFLFRFMVENNHNAKLLYERIPYIPHDPTQVLWYLHRDEPFDDKRYKEIVSESFFQKTNFKNQSAKNPIPGSMAEYIVNGETTGNN